MSIEFEISTITFAIERIKPFPVIEQNFKFKKTICERNCFLTKLLQLVFLIGFITNTKNSNAQLTGCIDPFSIYQGYFCPDPSYKPVCGCDAKTYRNTCEAQYRNGVINWTDGTCSGFEFDIYPTYVSSFIHFTFVQRQNDFTRAELLICDYFGSTLYKQTLTPDQSGRVELLINDVIAFRPGPYIIYIFNNRGDYRWKKFVKFGYD